MTWNFKKFKASRQAGFNLFSSPKYAFKILLKKPANFHINSNPPLKLLKTSFFFKNKQKFFKHLKKVQFVKKKKDNSFLNKNVVSLEYCLYATQFFKSIPQARFAVKKKAVFVNNKCIKYSNFSLKPGDFVQISMKKNMIKKTDVVESFFFTRYKSVFIQKKLPYFFEVSFATKSFFVC